MEQDRADSILAALPWRCFHCDFLTTDPAEALAHFGERDDAEEFKPVCKWWDSLSEDERKATLQDTIKQLNERDDELMRALTKIEGLEYQVGSVESCIRSYKPFNKCRTIHDVFCEFDSMEGRALAAEERLKELGPLTPSLPSSAELPSAEPLLPAYNDPQVRAIEREFWEYAEKVLPAPISDGLVYDRWKTLYFKAREAYAKAYAAFAVSRSAAPAPQTVVTSEGAYLPVDRYNELIELESQREWIKQDVCAEHWKAVTTTKIPKGCLFCYFAVAAPACPAKKET